MDLDYREAKVSDVSGEEVTVEELIGRLKYRQDARRKTGIIPDPELNFVVCFSGHVQMGMRRLDFCRTCHEKFRYVVKKGLLVVGRSV